MTLLPKDEQQPFVQRRVFANGQGHVEGFLLISQYNKEPFFYIHSVFVKQKYRGSGMAAKLVRSSMRWAKKNGAYKAFCVCRPELEPVYRACGMTKEGIQMQKVLA